LWLFSPRCNRFPSPRPERRPKGKSIIAARTVQENVGRNWEVYPTVL